MASSESVAVSLFLYLALSFADRLLSAGAFDSITRFIAADLDTATPDAAFGALSSGYTLGYILGVISVGVAVARTGETTLVMRASGVAWVAAILVSGCAQRYWVLLAGRTLCGLSQAAVMVVAVPFVAAHIPRERRGLWMAVVMAALPLGMAVGPLYGSLASAASASLSWRAAYLGELALVVPCVAAYNVLAASHARQRARGDATAALLDGEAADGGGGRAAVATDAQDSTARAAATSPHGWIKGSLADVWAVVSSPLLLLLYFGYAGFLAVLAGAGAMSGQTLVGVGAAQTAQQAAIISLCANGIAGTAGCIVGGKILDSAPGACSWRCCRRLPKAHAHSSSSSRTPGTGVLKCSADDRSPLLKNSGNFGVNLEEEEGGAETASGDELAVTSPSAGAPPAAAAHQHLARCLAACAWATAAGAALYLAAFAAVSAGLIPPGASTTAAVGGRAAFLVLYCGGCLAVMAAGPAFQTAVSAAVPPRLRCLAVAAALCVGHLCGDVPSAALIGALMEHLAPRSGGACSGGGGGCSRSPHGMQSVALVVYSGLALPVLLWSAAYHYAAVRARHPPQPASGSSTSLCPSSPRFA